MKEYNYYALLGIPFAILFIINALRENSPFIIPYFKELQEKKWGKKGLKLRMLATSIMILVMSTLAFFNLI